ncbi:chemotaxis protein CheA [Dyella nitratireducens]|uniref:histidine kinase n=1 Tax=Dyella nitratireducens TaxID=1849580 RepID=A0ABQ1FR17_9GAMM|nr:chemotaxis protein CheA [Dyella nitratireducens]GGA27425.1 chemotaxis protein CheA [Dyella nitratireducens]GLQ43416.1 chemotaxis protein CheA [Dyella nitratireducens]
MDANLDSELRDDFLVEAGELVQRLGEQLIELEASPHDRELLNAVFRVFHTVKGGAGFLGIEPMVQLCHCAEELLNDARNGRLVLNSTHMDALLEALDLLNGMMAALANGDAMSPPPAALLEKLQPAAESAVAAAEPAKPVRSADPIEAEFEALLDTLYGQGGAPGATKHVSNDINDDEFESLLDTLHGKGAAPGAAKAAEPEKKEISDDEFEALLDNLHGKGSAPGQAAAVAVPSSAPIPVPAPVAAEPARPAGAAKTSTAENTVRVDTTRLDTLVSRAGELVLLRNRLLSLASRSDNETLAAMAGDLDRVSDDLQNAVLGMRMQPVGRLFQRFPRIVRDLARQLGKDIELITEGEETDLDRSLVEALADPLIHLLRNAVDHGLEDPAGRERAGKPRKGKVKLSASQRGERIVISVSDDGRGMDPEVLRRKAVEKGVIDATQAARLSEVECYELIFRPGFSTAAQISDISGRGVGMDVVKTRVAELGGTLQVYSRLGHGSTLELTVPLTLAILRVLMVRVGDRLFALPLGNVSEVFELSPQHDHMLDGRRVAAHRGRALVLGDLGDWAAVPGPGGRHVVVLHVGHMHLGCLVHEVIGREDVMVKPLGPLFEGVPGVAGATVTGDGRLALVLDLAALSQDDGRLLPSLKVSA